MVILLLEIDTLCDCFFVAVNHLLLCVAQFLCKDVISKSIFVQVFGLIKSLCAPHRIVLNWIVILRAHVYEKLLI